ncbi:hypothetical protein L204_103752 [Cryptococcus depauperatus]
MSGLYLTTFEHHSCPQSLTCAPVKSHYLLINYTGYSEYRFWDINNLSSSINHLFLSKSADFQLSFTILINYIFEQHHLY